MLEVEGQLPVSTHLDNLDDLGRQIKGTDKPAGFTKDRSALRCTPYKVRRKNKNMSHSFIYFQKAFYIIDQNVTWTELESYGVGSRLIGLLEGRSENAKAAVKIHKEIQKEWYRTIRNTRHGYVYFLASSSFVNSLRR